MISYLIGQPILEKEYTTILVGGVGYAVRMPEDFRRSLIDKTEVEAFIYTHVREESLDLYGFAQRSDRDLFLLLISVSGVGPKTALQILNLGSSAIIQAVQNADTNVFSSVPRVGKKMAQKIIIDLRSKLGALKELDIGPISPHREEVTLALQSLGFDERSIYQAFQVVDVENATTSEAITLMIKQLGKQ